MNQYASPAGHRRRNLRVWRAVIVAFVAGILMIPVLGGPPRITPAVATSACGDAGVQDTSAGTAPGYVSCMYRNRGTNGYGGSPDTFTVPANTHKLRIVLNGALHSGYAAAELAVTPE